MSTASDVPEALLNIDEVKQLACNRVKAPLNALNGAEKTMGKAMASHLTRCFEIGEALKDSKLTFKANKHKSSEFEKWAAEFTGKGASTVRAYIQVFEHKAILVNATGFDEARTMIKENNTDADGALTAPEKAKGTKHDRLTDSKRVTKILDQVGKLDNLVAIYDDLIKGIEKAKAEAIAEASKVQTERKVA